MKYRSFLGFLTVSLEGGSDERNFGRGCRSGFAASGTRLTPNIPRQDSTGGLKLYVSDVGAQAKSSTTRAKCGFTLAEVLITLSIIGIVAALTIPSLIVKNQDREIVTQAKKSYSVFSNAMKLAIQEYGSPDMWSDEPLASQTGVGDYIDRFIPFLNVTKRCKGTKGCFPAGVKYKRMTGLVEDVAFDDSGLDVTVLGDGTIFWLNYRSPDCNEIREPKELLSHICAYLHIDVNGNKGPNTMGKDTLAFFLTKESLIPFGIPNTNFFSLKDCRLDFGWGCTAWVLLKENLNFPPAGTGWD